MMKLKQLICRLEEMSQAESRGATEKELIQGVKFVFALMLIEIDLGMVNDPFFGVFLFSLFLRVCKSERDQFYKLVNA